MPEKTVHCRICGKAIRGYDFKERMDKLRKHRKKEHPTAHKRSVKKATKTKGTKSYPYKRLDPSIKVRRKLVSKPRVLKYFDFKGKSLVRLLYTEYHTLFPEFAIYIKFKGLPHDTQDQMLKEAGLVKESNGKWVLRTDKFSIFVYV